MTYILDTSKEKQSIIDKVATNINLQPFTVMPKCKFDDRGTQPLENCIFPAVTQWLRGFMDAEAVVTDSFHGCVFSIIFEKPFIAILNNKRGASRFISLLEMFNLSERAVNSISELTDEMINKPIDWDRVRAIKENKINEGISFLNLL